MAIKLWTPVEDALVRELYPDHSARYIAEHYIEHRTWGAIQARAFKLGVHKRLLGESHRQKKASEAKKRKPEVCRRSSCPYARRITYDTQRCLMPCCMQEDEGAGASSAN